LIDVVSKLFGVVSMEQATSYMSRQAMTIKQPPSALSPLIDGVIDVIILIDGSTKHLTLPPLKLVNLEEVCKLNGFLDGYVVEMIWGDAEATCAMFTSLISYMINLCWYSIVEKENDRIVP
jgi:hypothetical protein